MKEKPTVGSPNLARFLLITSLRQKRMSNVHFFIHIPVNSRNFLKLLWINNIKVYHFHTTLIVAPEHTVLLLNMILSLLLRLHVSTLLGHHQAMNIHTIQNYQLQYIIHICY